MGKTQSMQFVAFWCSLVSIRLPISWLDWSLKTSPHSAISILAMQTTKEFDPPKMVG